MCNLHGLSAGAGPGRGVSSLVAVAVLVAFGSSSAGAGESASGLVLAGRTVAQDQGAWVVDYRLKNEGTGPIVVDPEDLVVTIEGWVSNSRVASHAVPRRSTLELTRGPGRMAVCEVIAAADEERRCREKLLCQVSAVRGPSSVDGAATPTPDTRPPHPRTTDHGPKKMPLEPGDMVRVRLRLEHHHVIYGNYDPLLGARRIELALGGAKVRDTVALDREHYLAQPRFEWPEPPDDRRDTGHSVSGPDSLHLEAHVPGHHYYRYPDRPVRYGTPMRLRFWYLIAAGTEGECRFRIAQYKDTPTSWRMLNEAGFEEALPVVGRWTKVERTFNTDDQATTLALDFRIAGDADVGEMWIDDVCLEPIGCPGHPGP